MNYILKKNISKLLKKEQIAGSNFFLLTEEKLRSCILILITDDRDHNQTAERAPKKNWEVETWFWDLEPDLTGKMKVLEIPDGDIISNWENKDLIEWFDTLNLLVGGIYNTSPTLYNGKVDMTLNTNAY
ncbi:4731_t:CDS:2 [Diversispora eburnea]|uniref:4731_t:CDS:1 n=1 Tax=Diversispora eburnea TaxID=1213867 RepID=A0A9N8YJM0_9GLOM|nr:4731_t:CDS:2 [Diversispora eburnea]